MNLVMVEPFGVGILLMLRSVQSESGRCYDFWDVNPVTVAALPIQIQL